MLVEMLPQADGKRWGVLGLLFLSLAINLLDRQVLAVLAPVIRDELKLTNTEYSYIVTSFLIGLTLAQVPSGMLLDRMGARFGLPLLMLWWSAANGLHAVARGVREFCAFRFLLGVGECGNYSAGVKAIAQWFPANERALAGGIFNAGTVIGSFVAPFVIVKLGAAYGWRAAFLVPSALGLLWAVPWMLFYRDRAGAQAAGREQLPLAPLLGLRQVWGAMLMRAMAGPVIHFYWYWLPEYLKRERHFSMEAIGMLGGIPFLFAGLGNIGMGWLSAALMRRGRSVDGALKAAFVLCGALSLASAVVPWAPNEATALALISTASLALGGMAANLIGALGNLFSPRVLARITGLTGLCEGSVNIGLTLATGAVVDRWGYWPVFLAAGVMPQLALAALFLLIRKVERVGPE